MMKVEMLVSTMNQANQEFLKKMNINTNVTVVNQITQLDEVPVDSMNETKKFISLRDKGLSKSRNLALKHATKDICVVCDDDMKYVNSAESRIEAEYRKNPDADVIIFQVGNLSKQYPSEQKSINWLSTLKVSSVQITFKRESITQSNICFNEEFGAGSGHYISGEENIFLIDCLNKGLKIIYVPVEIGELMSHDSSWFRGYNFDYFSTKGAFFQKVKPSLSLPFILLFAIRKHKYYKQERSFAKAIKYMLDGRKSFKMENEG